MIEFKSICKTFLINEIYKNEVIKNLNLKVESKEALVIIGPSGVGKSVLVKILLKLIKHDSGEILFDKKNIDEHFSKIKFGVLFQGGALFDSMNVIENIMFPIKKNQKSDSKLKNSDIYDMAIEKLTSVGFTQDIATKYPSELSGGMQKRVALARAIITKPDIMIFDEPTTGLDPITGVHISKLINTTLKKLNITSITITHDLNVVKNVATRVAVFFDKQIIHECLPNELQNSKNEVVKHFYKSFYGE